MFQVGDKVAVYYHGFGDEIKIDEVVRVTPTGRVRLKKVDRQYDKTGTELGNRNVFSRSHIVPLTPELEQEIIQIKTVEKAVVLCHSVRNKGIDYETAKKLIELLDKKGEV